jgi:putative membrane protein
VRLVLAMATLAATVFIVPGLDFDGSVWALVAIAFVFGIINAIVRPIAMLLSAPLIILTVGIAALFVNGLMFWLVVWLADPGRLNLGLTSEGFWPAFWGAIVMGVVGWLLSALANRDRTG